MPGPTVRVHSYYICGPAEVFKAMMYATGQCHFATRVEDKMVVFPVSMQLRR